VLNGLLTCSIIFRTAPAQWRRSGGAAAAQRPAASSAQCSFDQPRTDDTADDRRRGAQAYLHGPTTTPIITVTTFNPADTLATLRRIADTIEFR
jgi:hypothetical protein